MKKSEIEKSLKRFLKKKVSYSLSLLVTFMITGGISVSSEGTLDNINREKELILKEIEIEKEKIESEIKKKDREIESVSKTQYKTLEEADWWILRSKEEGKGALFLSSYTFGKNKDKKLVHGNTFKTDNDKYRNTFAEVSDYKVGSTASSGWITSNSNYNINTTTYDYKSEIVVLPTLNTSIINLPNAPIVNVTSISEIEEPSVTVSPVNPIQITVQGPTTSITAPTFTFDPIVVNVDDIDISVQGPSGNFTIPTINAPTISVRPATEINAPSAPTVGTPVTPDAIVEVNPSTPKPPTVIAPNWTAYYAPGAEYLGRGNYINNVWLNKGTMYQVYLPAHNTFSNSPMLNYRGNVTEKIHANSDAPVFNYLKATAGTYVMVKNGINLPDIPGIYGGGVVNNGTGTTESIPGSGLTATQGGTAGGLTAYSGAELETNGGTAYGGYTDPVNSSHYFSFATPTAYENATNGQTFVFSGDDKVDQYHKVLFNHGTGANNITAYIGGGSTILSYPEGNPYITNSNIYMYGLSGAISAMVGHYNKNVDFSGTNFNILGDKNTILTVNNNLGYSWNAQGTGPAAGTTAGDPQGQVNIRFTNDVNIDRSETVILNLVTSWSNYAGHNNTSGGPDKTDWFRFYNTQYSYIGNLGGVNFENTGAINMNGYNNAAIRVQTALLGVGTSSFTPNNNLEATVNFTGDQNVGIWFANTENIYPTGNGFFRGNLNLNFTFGNSLGGESTQSQYGNIAGNDNTKTENAVAIIVDSGQSSKLDVPALYPVSKSSTSKYGQFNPAQGKDWDSWETSNVAKWGWADAYDTSGNVKYKMGNLKLNALNFDVAFGEYSKGNIAVVARNGSTIEWSGTNINDNAPNTNNAATTATETTLAYAEGVYFNAMQRGLENGHVFTQGVYHRTLNPTGIHAGPLSSIQDYIEVTQQGGKFYIQELRSTIMLQNDATVNSVNSVPIYAKDGGYITTKNITLNGSGSTGVMSFAEKENADLKTGIETIYDVHGTVIDTVSWSTADAAADWTTGETFAGLGYTRTDELPATEIKVTGNITATADLAGGDYIETDAATGEQTIVSKYNNTGAISVVEAGVNGSHITISGKVTVNGLGAFAKGKNATIAISGGGSVINTGTVGALVALDGGKITFAGGTINHQDTSQQTIDGESIGSHANSFIFYAAGTNSNINFTASTIMNVYDGFVFYGAAADFAGGTSSTAKYQNMGNVTVNLRADGVNLGVFRDINLVWGTGNEYLNGIKLIPKVAAINDNGFSYLSALDGGALNVKTNVNLDSAADGFNDITIERVVITVDEHVDGTSNDLSVVSTVGKTFAMASNKNANSNTEAGYIIAGTVDISNTAVSDEASVGIYTNFGQIKINSTGNIVVDKGVGVYGVNGSLINNAGNISINNTYTDVGGKKHGGIGILALSRKVDDNGNVVTGSNLDDYGIDGASATLTTTRSIDITNSGNINIFEAGGSGVAGTYATGIFADNNTDVAKANVTIVNSGKITLGDNGTGIYIKSGGTQGGTLTLTSKDLGATSDIVVGANSFAVNAEDSEVILSTDLNISLGGNNSVGIYLSGSGELKAASKTLKVDLTSSTGSSTGLYYSGDFGDTYINNANLSLTSASSDAVTGIYAVGTGDNGGASTIAKFTNSGAINTLKNSVGIYGVALSVVNEGKMNVTGESSVGIYMNNGKDLIDAGTGLPGTDGVMDTFFTTALSTSGGDKIVVNGKDAVGIYATSNSQSTNLTNVIVTAGTDALFVGDSTGVTAAAPTTSTSALNDNAGVGIYIEDNAKLTNASAITLIDSNITDAGLSSERGAKTGIYLLETTQDNTNTGEILVGRNNIGIYLEDSKLKNTGNISVEFDEDGTKNVGIYAKNTSVETSPGSGVYTGAFELEHNTGTIDVKGASNIGIAVVGDGNVSNSLKLGGNINVISTEMDTTKISIGVSIKGDDITTKSSIVAATGVNETVAMSVGANAIGMSVDGDVTTTVGGTYAMTLSSQTVPDSVPTNPDKEFLGIGMYFKGGSYAENDGNGGSLTIQGGTVAINSVTNALIRPIGIFYDTGSTKNSINVILDGNNETLGIYSEVASFINSGDITINNIGIGEYFKNTALTSTGDITISNTGYGMYLVGDKASTTSGIINVTNTSNTFDSIGAVVTAGGTLTNNSGGVINSNTETVVGAGALKGSIGVYISGASTTNGTTFINDGIVNATGLGIYGVSLSGATTTKSTITNNNLITTSYIGVYGDGANTTINHGTSASTTASLTMTTGKGIVSKGGTLNSYGTITGTNTKLMGAIGQDGATLNIYGNISLTGTESTGIVLNNTTGNTDKTILNLTSGNITVGGNSGNNSSVGIYSNNGIVNINNNYTDAITLGNNGIGIFLEKGSTLSGDDVNISYTATVADKGVGIFINKNDTIDNSNPLSPVTVPTTISTSVVTTSDDLIHIYALDGSVTNNATQTIKTDGVGIYAKKDTASADDVIVKNNSTLTLDGSGSFGVYLDGGAVLEKIGTITGIGTGIINQSENDKIGIYIENGDIKNSDSYTVDTNGGVGIYTKNHINYNGNIVITGNSYNNGTDDFRTIGILYKGISTLGTLSADITMGTDTDGDGLSDNGQDSVGIVLEDSKLEYNGTMNITSNSSPGLASPLYGVGVYLDNSTFDLNGGTISIGGTNNIGFYVDSSSILNFTNGTVTNQVDGTLSYLDGGSMTFSGVQNIDYANVIVAMGGTLTNTTTIVTGSKGLQAINAGSYVLNDTGAVINSITEYGKAIVAIDHADIDNKGDINLTGDKSVGIYLDNNATGNSTGNVDVKNNSTAYYIKNGSVLDVSGNTTIGTTSVDASGDPSKSTMFYVEDATINYLANSDITITDRGIVGYVKGATGTIDFNNKNVTIGEDSIGIILEDAAGITNLGDVTVGKDSVGIHVIDNASVYSTTGTDIILVGENAIGLSGTESQITNATGQSITSNAKYVLGITNKKDILNTGTIDNDGTINLIGDSSIGIYGEDITSITNSGITTVKDSETGSSAVGVYGKNVSNIANNNGATINFGESAIGIYGENVSNIVNTGDILTASNDAVGIYAVNSAVTNNGTISLGNDNVGVYVSSGTFDNNSTITFGTSSGTGVYSENGGVIKHYGNLIAGDNSTGLVTTDGSITIEAGSNINLGKESTYVYTDSGTALNKQNMTLSDYSVGMYTKTGIVTNDNGVTITVGKSDITVSPNKISVGMATVSGLAENYGTINVNQSNSVGMYVSDSGIIENHGTINVTGSQAYGILGTKETSTNIVNSKIYNYGTINVSGSQARGIAATSYTEVYNHGAINVSGTTGDVQGVYIDNGAIFANVGAGSINVNGTGNVGVYVGAGSTFTNQTNINISAGGTAIFDGSGGISNVGSIVINGTNVTIDGVTIKNSGTIIVNGALDIASVNIGSMNGIIGTIDTSSLINGEFNVLPEITQGTNKELYIVQYLDGIDNATNNGNLSVISQSVSFVAKLEMDKNDPTITNLILVKIPYVKLLEKTSAEEFGKGLDSLYATAKEFELKMFDALDLISDKDELAATFDNELRGNVYANIQTRMLDISDEFSSSFEKMKNSEMYNKSTLKLAAIVSGGESRNENVGVYDYDSTTSGVMVGKEYFTDTYGQSLNWNAGFSHTKFDFIDWGSEEEVYSVNLGIGLDRFIGKTNELKYETRMELTLNHNTTDREIVLSNGTYTNTGKYYSGIVEWKNKVGYEIGTLSNTFRRNIYGTMDLGYGKFENFTEKGDGIELEVKSEDLYMIRPGVGYDVSYTKYFNTGKLSLSGRVKAEYELGKIYDEPNQVKIADTESGYYNLEKPKDIKEIYSAGAELKYSTMSGHSIGVEVLVEAGSVEATTYRLNATYKF